MREKEKDRENESRGDYLRNIYIKIIEMNNCLFSIFLVLFYFIIYNKEIECVMK